ncbi:hypothetical protein HK096_011194, partial [Nowakowskiella sp. JEL0078]
LICCQPPPVSPVASLVNFVSSLVSPALNLFTPRRARSARNPSPEVSSASNLTFAPLPNSVNNDSVSHPNIVKPSSSPNPSSLYPSLPSQPSLPSHPSLYPSVPSHVPRPPIIEGRKLVEKRIPESAKKIKVSPKEKPDPDSTDQSSVPFSFAPIYGFGQNTKTLFPPLNLPEQLITMPPDWKPPYANLLRPSRPPIRRKLTDPSILWGSPVQPANSEIPNSPALKVSSASSVLSKPDQDIEMPPVKSLFSEIEELSEQNTKETPSKKNKPPDTPKRNEAAKTILNVLDDMIA